MYACQNMALELLVIDPTQDWFVLNTSYLDNEQIVDTGDDVLTPDPLPTLTEGDTFILDESSLNSTEDLLEGIGSTPAGYVWMDITSTTMYIDIKRGVDKSRSIVARPYAGTLEARVIDPYLDALSNFYLGLNTPVRLRVEDDVVFSGTATSLRTEYDAQGVPTLYLTATDAIARLNSITMAARSAETYQARMSAIAQAADVAHTIDPIGGQSLTATQDETNALELLYATQDSEGGLVWVDRWNKLHALSRGHDDLITRFYRSRTNYVPNPNMVTGFYGWQAYSGDLTLDTTNYKNGTSAYKMMEPVARENHVLNPSFASGITGFTGGSFQTDSWDNTTGNFGTGCLKAKKDIGTGQISEIQGYFTSVSVGQQVTASCYIKTNGTPSDAAMAIYWYNSSDGYISASTGSTIVPNSTWQRMSVTATAPANAAKFKIAPYANSVGVNKLVYFDDFLVEKTGTLGTYFDGTSSGASWTGSANASTSTIGDGTAIGLHSKTDTSAINISAGQTYTLSYWIKAIGTYTGPINVTVKSLNTAKAVVGTASQYANIEACDGTWQQGTFTFNSHTSADYVQVLLETNPLGAGNGIIFDSVVLEDGDTSYGYFDGGTAGASWAGTANQSQSSGTWYIEEDLPVKALASNDHSVPDHYCMTAFATGIDTDQVINQIEFNNLEWNSTDSRFEQKTYTFSDNTSANYYGVRKTTIRTTLNPASLSGYADDIFTTWAEARRQVKSLAIPADEFKDISVRDIVYIDIGDVVEVYLNDPANTMLNNLSEKRRVAEIYHRITPYLWETQIGLL